MSFENLTLADLKELDLDSVELEKMERWLLIDDARRGDFKAFITLTMPEFQWNWHHELMALYINDFIAGRIKRLMFFLPPRCGKSEMVSRRLPAFWHGLYPNDKIIAASYNAEMASSLTIDVQRIMDRPEFHEIFPKVWITPEGKQTGYKRTSSEHALMPYRHDDKLYDYYQGSYLSGGAQGSFTGRGAQLVNIDDPYKDRAMADSATERQNVWNTYTSALRTRLEKDGQILITNTRWHESDLSGALLNLAKTDPEADQWTVLSLPMVRDDLDNDEDPRQLGEVLWPDKYDANAVAAIKASVGTREWSALYQQQPTTEGGAIIKGKWIKFYTVMPTRFNEVIQSWDFAVKGKDTSDYNCGQVWGRVGVDCYLIYEVRKRCGLPDALRMVQDLTVMFPSAHRKLVEGKANGPAVMQMLEKTITGLIDVEPQGDKVARCNAVSPLYESGHVWYPDPSIAPWIGAHIEEITKFPVAKNDDRVDTMTMALQRFQKPTAYFAPISVVSKGF